MKRIILCASILAAVALPLFASPTVETPSAAPSASAATPRITTVTFEAADGLIVTADLAIANADKRTPFIVLFHRAGWSRGEYAEIVPKLCAMGFNCMAVDQRAGKEINGVKNLTATRAIEKGLPVQFVNALPDMQAAVNFARAKYSAGMLIVWGSSYSSALCIAMAAEEHHAINGVVAFSPGEYFDKQGKSATWIQDSARAVSCPVFLTSKKSEQEKMKPIFDAVGSPSKVYFVPGTEGKHGSEALWAATPESGEYWAALTQFLKQYLPK